MERKEEEWRRREKWNGGGRRRRRRENGRKEGRRRESLAAAAGWHGSQACAAACLAAACVSLHGLCGSSWHGSSCLISCSMQHTTWLPLPHACNLWQPAWQLPPACLCLPIVWLVILTTTPIKHACHHSHYHHLMPHLISFSNQSHTWKERGNGGE